MEQEETGGRKKRVKKKVLKRRGKGGANSRADEGESGESGGGGALLKPQDQVDESKSLPGSRRGSINDESKVPPVAGVFVRGKY